MAINGRGIWLTNEHTENIKDGLPLSEARYLEHRRTYCRVHNTSSSYWVIKVFIIIYFIGLVGSKALTSHSDFFTKAFCFSVCFRFAKNVGTPGHKAFLQLISKMNSREPDL